jgi:hypothetical protein
MADNGGYKEYKGGWNIKGERRKAKGERQKAKGKRRMAKG